MRGPILRLLLPLLGSFLLLPAGALCDGLRSVLLYGHGLPAKDLVVLIVWAAAGITLAARTFRWE